MEDPPKQSLTIKQVFYSNVEKLADKIVHVLNLDRQTIESMGVEARKNVIKKFEIEKMCFSTYTEYKKLIKK